MERLERFLRERVDSDVIDREGKIPSDVVQRAAARSARSASRSPTEYGGLGLSQHSYTHAIGLVTSADGNLTALLSAAQSIGVPQPLKLFGTAGAEEAVPARAWPRARSRAFALTETNVGSDPAGLAHDRDALGGRHALRPERREALVHQRHHRRAHGGDGADRARRRSPPSSSRPTGPASRWSSGSTSWGSRRSRTASSASPT